MAIAQRKLANIHEIREALARVQIWQRRPSEPVYCPLCDGPSFTVIDRSARPHTEWYVVKCEHCGLEDNISVPLCPQMGGGN